jgi:hypothetical protein
MRRDLFKRVSSLEVANNLVAADALRSEVSREEKIARINAVVSRLEEWRKLCRRAFAKRGEPHGWREYKGLRRFTQSVTMITWGAERNDSRRDAEEQTAIWLWDVLHAVYLARHCPGWGNTLRINAADAPIECSLMAALLADGPEALADVEIPRSRNSVGLPPLTSFTELWGLGDPPPGEVGYR